SRRTEFPIPRRTRRGPRSWTIFRAGRATGASSVGERGTSGRLAAVYHRTVASLSDLSFKHRLFLAAYRFRRLSPVPWALLRRPLAECRVALATSAGLYLPDQEPFDPEVRGGDPSFRVIPLPPAGVALSDIGLRHFQRSDAFDPAGIEKDPNLALPLDRLRELEAAGEIGSAAPRHLSFMGSITAPGRLRRETAPKAVEVLLEDRVDALVLCPV